MVVYIGSAKAATLVLYIRIFIYSKIKVQFALTECIGIRLVMLDHNLVQSQDIQIKYIQIVSPYTLQVYEVVFDHNYSILKSIKRY